jgi:hypothetical protein
MLHKIYLYNLLFLGTARRNNVKFIFCYDEVSYRNSISRENLFLMHMLGWGMHFIYCTTGEL